MYFHEKLQNALKFKDSTFNVFDEISGFRKLTKLCFTILEMTICLLFKLKVNFFDNYDILGEIAKYKSKLFFGPDSMYNVKCNNIG